MSDANTIIAQARGWLGVPFCHQGRSKQGVDCLGLLVMVAGELGLQFNGLDVRSCDETTYGHRPDTEKLAHGLSTYLVRIESAQIQPGDIALMRIEHLPQHLAIISDYPDDGELAMIHAYAPARKVVEHRLCENWMQALAAVFRLPQLLR